MRLLTVVRVTTEGVSGESVIQGDVSERYSVKQLHARVERQFHRATAERDRKLMEKRALADLQIEMFDEPELIA